MKNKILPLLAVLLSAAPLAADRIITVDSNPANVAMYHDFQAAYDAAEDGDTLLVQGTFGGYDIYKRLTIKSERNWSADFNQLRLRRDTAIGSSSGTKLLGLRIDYLDVQSGLSDIEIRRCYARAGWDFYSPALLRSIYHEGAFGQEVVFHGGSSGSVLLNSRINILELGTTNIVVDQCYVWRLFNGHSNTTVSNTIFRISDANFSANGTAFSHCIAVGEDFLPSGSGNQNNVTNDELWVLGSTYTLAENSVAKSASSTGGDIGETGGLFPYTLEVGMPRVLNLTAPGVATDTTGLPFTVEARAYPQ
jgi:hypothetical protein